MQIMELGLSPSLQERTEPLDTLLDFKMLDKAAEQIELRKKLNRRKKRLMAILRQVGVA